MNPFCTDQPLEKCAGIPAGDFGGIEVHKMEYSTEPSTRPEFPDGVVIARGRQRYNIMVDGKEVPLTKENASERHMHLVKDDTDDLEYFNKKVARGLKLPETVSEGMDHLPAATIDEYDPHAREEDFIFPTSISGMGSKVETLPDGSMLPPIDNELEEYEEEGDYIVAMEGGYDDVKLSDKEISELIVQELRELQEKENIKRYNAAMKIL